MSFKTSRLGLLKTFIYLFECSFKPRWKPLQLVLIRGEMNLRFERGFYKSKDDVFLFCCDEGN